MITAQEALAMYRTLLAEYEAMSKRPIESMWPVRQAVLAALPAVETLAGALALAELHKATP